MLTRLVTRTRCGAVVLVVSVLGGGLVRTLARGLAGPVRTVDDAVVHLCLAALLCALGWAWAATLATVVEAWRGRPAQRRVATPLRRVVLLLCGVALAAPIGTAAADEHPSPGPSIAGLPLPDRATGPAHPRPEGATPPPADVATRSIDVRTGDCLWHLAAADLRTDASPARVAARWHAIYRLNAAVIGPEPDLIHPGQRLVLPPR